MNRESVCKIRKGSEFTVGERGDEDEDEEHGKSIGEEKE